MKRTAVLHVVSQLSILAGKYEITEGRRSITGTNYNCSTVHITRFAHFALCCVVNMSPALHELLLRKLREKARQSVYSVQLRQRAVQMQQVRRGKQ